MTTIDGSSTRRASRPAALACATALAAIAVAARAEVRDAAAEAFTSAHAVRVEAPPARVYEAIGDVAGWWSSTHTYSGDAANLTLSLEPGGCFCERWRDGAVAHGRVLMAWRERLVRLDAPLGPLQAKPVVAVLTFGMKPDGDATALAITLRVAGPAAAMLDKDAPAVDAVLGEQVRRLKVRAETGRPPA